MQSNDVDKRLHTTLDHYYEAAITGPAVPYLGEASDVRLVAVMIGAIVDDCDPCISDATDAVAINADACAVVYRMNAMRRGMTVAMHGEDGEDAMVAKLAALRFERRHAMITIAIAEILGRGHQQEAAP